MPQENTSHEFTADDLAMLDDGTPAASDSPDPEAKADENPGASADPTANPDVDAGDKDTDPAADDGDKAAKPNGADKDTDPEKGYWPEDWRERVAKHLSAGDDKVYQKELKRLQRFSDPSGIYGMAREAENKLHTSGLVKIPAKDAKPEEIAEFHKAMGVPDKPEEYFDKIELENGAVLGDADKPVADAFAEAVHKAGATPEVMNAALNWYFQHQEKLAADLDEADDTFRRESEAALKEEFGPAFTRKTNAIESLFATAPGGTDVTNQEGLYARLMGGRMADGRLIGNDPDLVRWMVSMAQEFNPAAAVTESGTGNAQTLQEELDGLYALRSSDRKKYDSPEVQARVAELIEALEKHRARA
ncbi:MAG: hypothetical protein ACOC9Q_00750 [bacterium]